MPGTAKIMFLWPTGPHDLIGHFVQSGEGGIDEPCHVAIVLDDCLLEATILGVRKTPLDRYKRRRCEIWQIEVPYPEHGVIAAQLLEGRKYGWLSCIAGWLRDKFRIKVPFVDSYHDDCSETGTIYLRCMGLKLFAEDNPTAITPRDLYDELRRLGGELVERWPAQQN
jgi:hypothetical protein